MNTGAVFDPTGLYRYTLWREWQTDASRISFIMLNPSTADATHNDPTIRRCLHFARSWGYGALEVVNLFAFRATEPTQLRQAIDPVGWENDDYVLQAIGRSQTILLAWGNYGTWMNRHQAVLQLLHRVDRVCCFGITQAGQPRHPLYTKSNIAPSPFHWS